MSTFSLTIPPSIQRLLDAQEYAGPAAAKAVMRTALDARDLLAAATPVKTGDTARRWQVTKTPTATDPTAMVSNDSIIMVYLEYGTPPHKITAKNGKALAFIPQAGSRISDKAALYKSAKTGRLITTKARAATVLVQSVNHPGTKPTFTVRRNLGKIAGMLNQNMRDEIVKAMNGG